MSAFPPKADMCGAIANVCFGPIADMNKINQRGSLTDKPSLVFSGHCKRCLNLARPADELESATGAPNRQTSFSQGDYYIPLPVVRSGLRFREIGRPATASIAFLF